MKEVHLSTGLYDNKVLVLADNENLKIRVVGKTLPNLTYLFKAKNGTMSCTKKVIDNLVEFERKDLVYGKFQAKIIVMANENVVKEYELEDLILKEENSELKVIPEFEILKGEFNKVKSENEAMKQEIAELRELCENTKNLVVELNGLTEKVGV